MTGLERFLIDRYLRDRWDFGHDEVGVSSNAMLREAITGEDRIGTEEYPLDFSDLSRCCATFAKAPHNLKEKMLPRLIAYCEYVGWRRGVLPPAVEEPQNLWSRFLAWAGWS